MTKIAVFVDKYFEVSTLHRKATVHSYEKLVLLYFITDYS